MVPRLSLEQMVESSERIVHGRSVRSWSAWDADHRIIWTHYEIEVSDSLKGEPVRTMVVSEPGGAVDGMELTIAGMPRYGAGEEMVMFLYRTPIGLWRARGLGQGKYAVVKDGDGAVRVHADLGGAVVIEPNGTPTAVGTDLRQLDGMPLDQVKLRIRALANRPAKGAK